jgi:hypothetical protein
MDQFMLCPGKQQNRQFEVPLHISEYATNQELADGMLEELPNRFTIPLR